MAAFNSLDTLCTIRDTQIVPVFYNPSPDVAQQVLKACYDGGIRVFEFTNRGDNAHDVFRSLLNFTRKECPQMILGVGSIVDPSTAALYMQMGANFIVGPLFNPEIAKVCNRHCVPYIPGCSTASEVGQAQEAGASIVKIFPGEVATPAFVKAILAPMPWSKLMITGGVEPSEENIASWLKAGAFCLGMGSKLFPKQTIEQKNWTEITNKCRTALHIVQQYSSR